MSGTYYHKTQKWYYSPRIQINQRFHEQTHLKASWSQYNQFVRELTHENYFGEQKSVWLLSDELNIPVAKSTHWMVGMNQKLGEFEMDVEFYFKKMEGMVNYAIIEPGFNGMNFGLPEGNGFSVFSLEMGHQKAWICF